MRCISFDVGIKNLAYCVIDYDASKPLVDGVAFPENEKERASIVGWQVVVACAIKRPTVPDISDGVYARLDEIYEEHGAPDVVLIENQPCIRNPSMKTVQVMIYSYYVMRDRLQRSTESDDHRVRVHFVNAGLKLTGLCSSREYRERKRASIQAAAPYLSSSAAPSKTTAKKRDDLADCLLQALQWLRRDLQKS